MSRANFELAEEIVKQIDAYLDGTCPGADVVRWAAKQQAENEFSSAEVLLDEALTALTFVGWENPEWDTPKARLQELRAALKGEADYVVTLSLRWFPKPLDVAKQ